MNRAAPHFPILLLGPLRTGKTSLARLVANSLKAPHISHDDVRQKYYSEVGYDARLARQIRAKEGFIAMMLYWMLFDLHSVKRILEEYPNAVIDFGAGVGPYENRQQFQQLQEMFAPIENVFLILPSADPDETLRILRQRDDHPPMDLHFDINAHFIGHPGYQLLAKQTIYNAGQTPEQSCEAILKLLR